MWWTICFPQQWISTLLKSSSLLPLWVAQKYLISWWANPLGSSRAVCAVTWLPVSDRELMGRTNFFSCECNTTALSLWHCQRITQERNSVYFGCRYGFGFRGRDKAQILRWKAIFYVLAASLVPLLTFPEDFFHMLNNVLLHHHNRDSQPKGLKD